MENKLPEEFKKNWVAALRSGEYKQGKEQLYNPNTDCYCCLGVAGKIAGVSNETIECNGEFEEIEGELPELLVSRKGNKVPHTLIVMNDDDGRTFNEIADYIEANL